MTIYGIRLLSCKIDRLFVLFGSLFIFGCSRDKAQEPEPTVNTEPPAPHVAPVQKVAADRVYTNGRIYTVNKQQPWAEAVAVGWALAQ